MGLQSKLLVLFVLTVFLTVAPVTIIVSSVTRRAFERAENDRTAALVSQFRREFGWRGEEIARQIGAIASSEVATRVALSMGRGEPDYGALLNAARNVASDQQLDFLEFLSADGTILSSAQWPAKIGYKEPAFSPSLPATAFLQREE